MFNTVEQFFFGQLFELYFGIHEHDDDEPSDLHKHHQMEMKVEAVGLRRIEIHSLEL